MKLVVPPDGTEQQIQEIFHMQETPPWCMAPKHRLLYQDEVLLRWQLGQCVAC